jgi:phosphohistidine swiveling domain-containing protein
MAEPLSAELSERLRDAVADLGGDVIVRSSAGVEAAGEWAGAFSTFTEIGTAEVGTAVRGCWASAFGVDVVERAERIGLDAADVTVAVLIQPRIEPRVAGLARLRGDSVDIDVVKGSPAALMSGWAEGQRIVVEGDGTIQSPADALLTDDEALALAQLTRLSHERLGHGVVEWAHTGDSLVLLQTLAVAVASAPAAPPETLGLPELDDARADHVARLALAFPGGINDDLVFPWALGLRDTSILETEVPPLEAEQLDLEEARHEAYALARQVWGDSADAIVERARALLRDLRGGTPRTALEAIDGLTDPDPDRAAELIRRLRRAGNLAAATGQLRSPDDVFGCELADLETDRRRSPRQSWAGARRWEPFLVGVAQTRGRTVGAVPASPGVGAGRARVVLNAQHPPAKRHPREVIVAPLPVPGLSAMLWDAAALVTVGGSAGAHLIEVARSLGVPAVVGCTELPDLASLGSPLIAVDGDAGLVSHHRL